jgi:hypothetical protein
VERKREWPCIRGEPEMKSEEELVLKITKEIVVKLIEVGNLSISTFDTAWTQIHRTVTNSLKEGVPGSKKVD